jgi:peptidylprolyl isomerase
MSKPNKTKKIADAQEKKAATGNKTLVIAIGVIIIIAIIAIAAFVVLAGAPVKNGDTVSVYYTGTLTNGSVFDSNLNKSTMTVTVGAHRVIPGFENALVGMKAGETKTVTIPVDQAYGSYNPAYVHEVNRTGNLATMDLVPGKTLSYTTPDGGIGTVTILKVTPDKVTIDENSPLAGQPLTFTINLVSINKDAVSSSASGN